MLTSVSFYLLHTLDIRFSHRVCHCFTFRRLCPFLLPCVLFCPRVWQLFSSCVCPFFFFLFFFCPWVGHFLPPYSSIFDFVCVCFSGRRVCRFCLRIFPPLCLCIFYFCAGHFSFKVASSYDSSFSSNFWCLPDSQVRKATSNFRKSECVWDHLNNGSYLGDVSNTNSRGGARWD